MTPIITAVAGSAIAYLTLKAVSVHSLQPSKKLVLESFILLKNINDRLLTDLHSFRCGYFEPETKFIEGFTLDKYIHTLQDVKHLLLTDENYKMIRKASSAVWIEKTAISLASHIRHHLSIRAAYEDMTGTVYTMQQWPDTAAA